MTNFEISFENKYDISILKEKLRFKGGAFSQTNKQHYGYDYLMDLFDKIPDLKFRNEHKFYQELAFIIQEFPVVNNGFVRGGYYFYHLRDFKNYIRIDFGLLPKNRIFWRRFWAWFFVLFFGFAILVTPLFGVISAILLGAIFAQTSENNKRKEGIVLGVNTRE